MVDVVALDVECYPNYFLVMFSTGEYFEQIKGTEIDIKGLTKALQGRTIYTFNGSKYDLQMITMALHGRCCNKLKQLSDDIINNFKKPWELETLAWIDHVDLLPVSPGAGQFTAEGVKIHATGLKSYGARMHTRKLQDLPYDPSTWLNWYQIARVREYCKNDLQVTLELKEALSDALELRESMSAAYGLDLRSKSSPQIAEAVFKKMIGRWIDKPHYPTGYTFYFESQPWMALSTPGLLEKITTSPFVVSDIGRVEFGVRELITIGGSAYQMGIGGLHSTEKSVSHLADADHVLTDFDVTSYYPASILNTGVAPKQLGDFFRRTYRAWRDDRIRIKNQIKTTTDAVEVKKLTSDADAKKLFLNGIFGKLLEKYSIFYAPEAGITVTITGQVALLMLIESLEMFGIPVVSANTDGIVVKCRRDMLPIRDAVIAVWQKQTNYELESAEYVGIYSRDVNNYIAVKPNGSVKLKGVFAPPIPTASNWPSPSGNICTTALVNFITKGVPIESTIKGCQDIREFVYVRAVKGGGLFTKRKQFIKRATKNAEKEAKESFGFTSWQDAIDYSKGQDEYLGKMVRWYYSTDGGSILYAGSRNQVARATGVSPCMELPDLLPDDLDINFYITECRSLAGQIGLKL